MKPIRNSSLTILVNTISMIIQIISSSILVATVTDLKTDTIFFFSFLTFILLFIINITIWLKNTFYIDETTFYYKSGILINKEYKIPLNNILAINLEENIKQKIFNLKTLIIDRGASNNIEDIKIILKKGQAIDLRNKLLEKNTKSIKQTNNIIYFLNFKNLFLFSIMRNRFLNLIIVSISLLGFLYQTNIHKLLLKINSPLNIIFIFITFLVLINIITSLLNLIRYYNYRISKHDNILEISSGFFKKKVSNLNTEKIFAIKTTQNIFQKITNKTTVSVSTFGYQDDIDEEALLFPYLDKDISQEIILNLLPKFIYNDQLFNINKKYKIKHKKYFFGYNDELLYLSKGLLKRVSNTIKIDSIEEITFKQSYFQKKYKTYKLILGYKGKKFSDLNRLTGVDKNHIDNIIDILIQKEKH